MYTDIRNVISSVISMSARIRKNRQVRHVPFRAGFTLIELLVVIGVLAILLAITLVAINPARQFQQARDTQRRSDVQTILNAVGQFYIDNGQFPLGVDSTNREIAAGGANADLCFQIVTRYIAAMPVDPQIGDPVSPCDASYTTGYFIRANGDRVTVSATSELNPSNPIEATR